MIELTTVRKHKVTLSDYDYKRDIENRLILSEMGVQEHAVLDEILFSPIRTTVRKISKNIDIQEDVVVSILQKLAKTGLISFEEDAVVVDKEMRKYFETEIEKFDENFQAGMEFLQHLLKKVPIHILPHWYAIPRTSNNIFESLVEKYLLTPQTYQRYLMDLTFSDPALSAIAQDVLKAPNFEVPAQEIKKKYNLTPEKFHEAMLTLEFHFVCALAYRKNGGSWSEFVVLFSEWKEHLSFLKETAAGSISDMKKIARFRPTDFAFVDDMTAVLVHAKKQPKFLSQNSPIKFTSPLPSDVYLKRIILKIEQVHLAELQGENLVLTASGEEWIDLRSENRAIYLYRHPTNERIVREVEKSIIRIVNAGWVLFSDFLLGVYAPVADGQSIALKKTGKIWKYQRPVYSTDDLSLIESVICDHLFEAGIIILGSYQGQRCICVTPFGQSLFG